MNVETQLRQRAGDTCELCGASEGLAAVPVAPKVGQNSDEAILGCATCAEQIGGEAAVDVNHWRCLNDSAWSQVPAVQVVAWRMLNRLSGETWARDLLDMLYLDEETLAWAKASSSEVAGDDDSAVVHKDTHGAVLAAGDTVTLIKDLKVKGANFTAKRGTAVRNIGLVHDNPAHIEGRVNDQRIVILTEYVKKA